MCRCGIRPQRGAPEPLQACVGGVVSSFFPAISAT